MNMRSFVSSFLASEVCNAVKFSIVAEMEDLRIKAINEVKNNIDVIRLAARGAKPSSQTIKEAVEARYNMCVGMLNTLHTLGIITIYDFQELIIKASKATKEGE